MLFALFGWRISRLDLERTHVDGTTTAGFGGDRGADRHRRRDDRPGGSRLLRKVRQDEVLAPVFAARITDWEPHLARMCEFWSSVALMTGIYHGRPMEKHLPLPVDGRHFDRWLRLFRETAQEVCPAAAAAHFIERAERIAQSLEMGIAVSQGVLLTKGARLRRPDSEVAWPAAAQA